jgi:L-iditol 2-dehydrogenase
VRAVVLDDAGQPSVADVPAPDGPGELIRLRACGLCGSDVEKLGRAAAGTVLGHEVVGELENGLRVVLGHHRPCGECRRCRAGHESACAEFAAATIRPGGFAEQIRADFYVELSDGVDDLEGTFAEPLACVLRGAERLPHGRILVVGYGSVGRLFGAVLRRRGDTVFAVDVRPERAGVPPDGPVDAAVLCGPAGASDALATVEPGGRVLVFASAGGVDLDPVYRRELEVVGSRGTTPRHLREAVQLLEELDLPEPTAVPLERFRDGLELYRSGKALKIVYTP